jgi:transmembrane sensor
MPGENPEPVAQAPETPAPAGAQVLDDGTRVELNRGAAITVQFTSAERRVRLDRGEAHFAVTKDATRPFVVNAGDIDVRAVGTAFNVRVDRAAVEVLVTEGIVQLDAEAGPPEAVGPANDSPPVPLALLEARQRAVVSLAGAGPPQIATLTKGEIERVLAWQHRLLDFTAAPLAEIIAEFNHRNVVQLVLLDPELASVRISASFRSDNIAGFVHLLEAGFEVRAERRGETEIRLRKAQ